MARKWCAHLSSKIRTIESATQGHRCNQCIEKVVRLIVVASKSAGKAFEWLIFASKHTQFWSFWAENSGVMSCVGSGKMRSDRANNEQEHRHWSHTNGFGFNFGKNWARGRGELAMCSKSSSSAMRWNVWWCTCFSALQVDVSNKSNTNYIFVDALSRGGVGFRRFWEWMV